MMERTTDDWAIPIESRQRTESGGRSDRRSADPSARASIASDDGTANAASNVASAHRRFARAAIGSYVCAAALTVGLLIAALLTDLSHERSTMRRMLLGETKLRAQYFSWYLGLLENELRRLSLRSEVNLLDRDMEPERSLLELSHNKSTFFNVGVAIIGSDGIVAWSEPRTFLAPGQSVASNAWFEAVRSSGAVHIEPEQPERESDALVYVASPIVRSGRFSGALLGAIDLTADTALTPSALADLKIETILTTREGVVVYPAKPPPFAAEPVWRDLFRGNGAVESFSRETRIGNRSMVTAAAAVAGADLYLLSLVDQGRLFGPARLRLYERLALGVVVTTIPFFLLVRALQRSLESFRHAQEQRNREEQLRLVGEAVNVIAHEVTNSLNGLRVGVDLMVPERGLADERKKALTLHALRSELQRLTDFTTELLIFSKGIHPRPARLEIGEFVDKVIEVTRERATEQGVALTIERPDKPCAVRADPHLLHVVLVNLVGNALDAVAMSNDRNPRISVELSEERGAAQIRVSDNGPGVSASMRHALFQPFVSGKANGTGIGLALSRKIARAHGGDLVLERNGPGATFLLNLPKEDL
jgi:signal transduction histidine kinase